MQYNDQCQREVAHKSHECIKIQLCYMGEKVMVCVLPNCLLNRGLDMLLSL